MPKTNDFSPHKFFSSDFPCKYSLINYKLQFHPKIFHVTRSYFNHESAKKEPKISGIPFLAAANLETSHHQDLRVQPSNFTRFSSALRFCSCGRKLHFLPFVNLRAFIASDYTNFKYNPTLISQKAKYSLSGRHHLMKLFLLLHRLAKSAYKTCRIYCTAISFD